VRPPSKRSFFLVPSSRVMESDGVWLMTQHRAGLGNGLWAGAVSALLCVGPLLC
jgi:hypothetical protein